MQAGRGVWERGGGVLQLHSFLDTPLYIDASCSTLYHDMGVPSIGNAGRLKMLKLVLTVLAWVCCGGGGGRGLSRKGDRSCGVQKQLKMVLCMTEQLCTSWALALQALLGVMHSVLR